MLRIIIISFLCFAGATSTRAQSHALIDSTTYDFGIVVQGENPTHTFFIKNTGTIPLLINSVEPACGCIVADFSKAPIAPGKTGAIKLIFVAQSKKGFQMRSTTVTTNADNKEIILYIKGTIVKKGR